MLELFNGLNLSDSYGFILDQRLGANPSICDAQSKLFKVRPVILSRLYAEFLLWRNVRQGEKVLCFGNLPPIFPLKNSRVFLYLQSPYLLSSKPLKQFNFRIQLRIFLERIWLRVFKSNIDTFIVQTQTMKLDFQKVFKGVPCIVYPFAKKLLDTPVDRRVVDHIGGFIYVSSGEPHKNHPILIEAWIRLASLGIFPRLRITLSQKKYPSLVSWIEQKRIQFNLEIENLGELSLEQVAVNYLSSDALIFPSKFETLGLPLLEAVQFGLPVLAAERDYVRDLITPSETFDPESSVSISRAVERFLGVEKIDTVKIRTGKEFMQEISNGFSDFE
jgi:glycosyltransferase involved in cell wall biosynthesis